MASAVRLLEVATNRKGQTMYANVHLDDDSGRITIKATAHDLKTWTTRPGSSWPCSMLGVCEHGIEVTLSADNGDLLDMAPLQTPNPRSRYELPDIPGDELTAFCDDALRDASAILLGALREQVPGLIPEALQATHRRPR